jgi:formate dehydrogenase
MAKVLSVLYDDPVTSYPPDYGRDNIPKIDHYPDGMTPHVSGTTLSAQARYAAGTREILEDFFAGKPIRKEHLIVQGGKLAGARVRPYRGATPPRAPGKPRSSRRQARPTNAP